MTARALELENESGLSHDLRNSLAALRLLVEAVRDGVLDADSGAGTFDQMLVHVGLLEALIDARSDADDRRRGDAAPRAVCIATMLEQWTDALGSKARKRRVALSVAVGPDLPEVHCRPEQIARVLLNLIGNALRYTPAGGRVVVHGLAHPGGVQIRVDDSGPGLPPEVHAGMLDGSARALSPRGAGGLGLIIARTIVQSHGGVLWAASPPSGASLRFYLPAGAARAVS